LAAFLHPFYKGSILHYKKTEPDHESSESLPSSAPSLSQLASSASKSKKTSQKGKASKRGSQRSFLDDDNDEEGGDERRRSVSASQSQPPLWRQLQVRTYEKDIYEKTKREIIDLMRHSRVKRLVNLGGTDDDVDRENDKEKESAKEDGDENLTDWDSIGAFLEEGNLSDFAKPKSSSQQEDEIERQVEHYLNMLPNLSKPEGDVLGYWKAHEASVPDLARLARRILAVPASSASSERLFSAAGRTITAQRTNLSSIRAEQLLFVQQNYDAVKDTMTKWDLALPKDGKAAGKKTQVSPASKSAQPSSDSAAGTTSKASAPAPDVANLADTEDDVLWFSGDETSDKEFGDSDSELDLVDTDDDILDD
jgi:KRAB domain-containing zinc finger protein